MVFAFLEKQLWHREYLSAVSAPQKKKQAKAVQEADSAIFMDNPKCMKTWLITTTTRTCGAMWTQKYSYIFQEMLHWCYTY